MTLADETGAGQPCLPEGEKLPASFYRSPAVEVVTSFLGKVLVHQAPAGRLSGVITDVEAYPAFSDGVHHGNKRTARSEVMWHEGGRAYVYLIYGRWHQVAAVVNVEGVPDVVFVRAVLPADGVEIMARQWDKDVARPALPSSPGKLCKSLLITTEHYGADLRGDELFIEDHAIGIDPVAIQTATRAGINKAREGAQAPCGFTSSPPRCGGRPQPSRRADTLDTRQPRKFRRRYGWGCLLSGDSLDG